MRSQCCLCIYYIIILATSPVFTYNEWGTAAASYLIQLLSLQRSMDGLCVQLKWSVGGSASA
jgi:hypothetical protein